MLQNSQIREDCAARDNLADSLGAGREGRLARSSAIWLALGLLRMCGGTCPHSAAGLSTQNSPGLEMI